MLNILRKKAKSFKGRFGAIFTKGTNNLKPIIII